MSSLYIPQTKPSMWAGPEVMAANIQRWHGNKGLPHPVLFLPMWEGAGNKVFDISGNARHGTLTSVTWEKEGTRQNSTSDYISCGNHAIHDFVGLDFTLVFELWPEVCDLGLWAYWNRGASTTDGWYVMGSTQDSTVMTFIGAHSGVNKITRSNTNWVKQNQKNIIVISFRINQEADIFVNGTEVSYASWDTQLSLTTADRNLVIGNHVTQSYGYSGIIKFGALYKGYAFDQHDVNLITEEPYGALYPVEDISYFDFPEIQTAPRGAPSVLSSTPQTKPSMWAGQEFMIANVARWFDKKGIPQPKFYAPLWEGAGSRVHDFGERGYVGDFYNNSSVHLWEGSLAYFKNSGTGNGSMVDFGDDTPPNVIGESYSEITVIARSMSTVAGFGDIIVSRYGSGSKDGFLLTVTWDSKFQFSVLNDAQSQKNGVWDTETVEINKWYNVVGIYDGSTVQCWVNGRKGTTNQAQTGTIEDEIDNPLKIGTAHADANSFTGFIDYVIIFDCVLDENQRAIIEDEPYGPLYPVEQGSYFDLVAEEATDLVVADAAHLQVADNIDLAIPLSVQESTHLQVADNLIIYLVGTTCWGHDTGVTQTNIRNFSGNWSGTATISGAGDAEIVTFQSGQYLESEIIFIGSGTKTIDYDEYQSGSGPAAVVKYKTGATVAACEGDTWNTYSTSFESTGYAKIRIEKT